MKEKWKHLVFIYVSKPHGGVHRDAVPVNISKGTISVADRPSSNPAPAAIGKGTILVAHRLPTEPALLVFLDDQDLCLLGHDYSTMYFIS